MELVKTSNLKKYYRTGEICIKALDHVNLSVEEGEFIAVVGPSGCGKTTLLNMLGGLDNPTEGTVRIHGKDITKMKSEELTVYRRKHIYVKGIMYCLFSRVVLRNCMITDDFVFSKGRVIITF